jgi:hypothetical protein
MAKNEVARMCSADFCNHAAGGPCGKPVKFTVKTEALMLIKSEQYGPPRAAGIYLDICRFVLRLSS